MSLQIPKFLNAGDAETLMNVKHNMAHLSATIAIRKLDINMESANLFVVQFVQPSIKSPNSIQKALPEEMS
jgi:hypothetical protein